MDWPLQSASKLHDCLIETLQYKHSIICACYQCLYKFLQHFIVLYAIFTHIAELQSWSFCLKIVIHNIVKPWGHNSFYVFVTTLPLDSRTVKSCINIFSKMFNHRMICKVPQANKTCSVYIDQRRKQNIMAIDFAIMEFRGAYVQNPIRRRQTVNIFFTWQLVCVIMEEEWQWPFLSFWLYNLSAIWGTCIIC